MRIRVQRVDLPRGWSQQRGYVLPLVEAIPPVDPTLPLVEAIHPVDPTATTRVHRRDDAGAAGAAGAAEGEA